MKNILSIILLSTICSFTVLAQGLYIGAGGGYGFSAAKISFQETKTTYTTSSTLYDYKAKYYSFGKGINPGLYVGYLFTKNIGAELGFSYLMGTKLVLKDETINISSGPSNNSTDEVTFKGNMIRLTPAIKITGGENNFHPYLKAGLIVGLNTRITTEEKQTSTGSSPSVEETTTLYKGGISLGFHGAAGINYMFNDMMGIYAEVAGNYQNWAMKKSEVTKYTVNGVDKLNTMTTSEKETEYLDSYTYDSSASSNTTQPTKQGRFYLPFSSVGFNVGIHITLSKK